MSARRISYALSTALLLAAFSFAGAQGKADKKKGKFDHPKDLTPDQSALVDQAILREKDVVKALKERNPMIETYIQVMRPDPLMRTVPDSDQHFLGRLQLGKSISVDAYQEDPAYRKAHPDKRSVFKSSIDVITARPHYSFNEAGFAQMLLIDLNDFDRQHYNFAFVRKDFLGTVPTAVFDVYPSIPNPVGRFFGRIWIETGKGNIVRINGDYAGGQKDYHEYAHFDSWRTNVQPDVWLPTSTYIEDMDSKGKAHLSYKASNHVWGYTLKLPVYLENTSIEVPGAIDQSTPDEGPLGAQRALVRQAENNVLDRLFDAGLLDAPSEYDFRLADMANNILAYNHVPVEVPVRVRTLLTEPLESFAVGYTIVLSKGLIDTTAVVSRTGEEQAGNLNALLAFQLGHIISDHKLDTKYAFDSRMMFPDNMTFRRVPMHHTEVDNTEAAARALRLLQVKELAGGQKYFGLYLQQLQARAQHLPSLTEPLIGDSLFKADTHDSFWMEPLLQMGERLNPANLDQQAAGSLGRYLTFNPWTEEVKPVQTQLEPVISASDKMPFEVSPMYLKLGYYKSPADTASLQPSTPVKP